MQQLRRFLSHHPQGKTQQPASTTAPMTAILSGDPLQDSTAGARNNLCKNREKPFMSTIYIFCRLLFLCMARSKTFPGLKNLGKRPPSYTSSLIPPCFLLILPISACSHPKSILSRRIEQPHFSVYHIGEFPKIRVKNNLSHFIIK